MNPELMLDFARQTQRERWQEAQNDALARQIITHSPQRHFGLFHAIKALLASRRARQPQFKNPTTTAPVTVP